MLVQAAKGPLTHRTFTLTRHTEAGQSLRRGRYECARALLRAGADPNYTNGGHDLTVFWAIDGGVDMTRLLHECGTRCAHSCCQVQLAFHSSAARVCSSLHADVAGLPQQLVGTPVCCS